MAQATCGCMQLLAIVSKERRNTRICFVYTRALAKFCFHSLYSWTLPDGKSYTIVAIANRVTRENLNENKKACFVMKQAIWRTAHIAS